MRRRGAAVAGPADTGEPAAMTGPASAERADEWPGHVTGSGRPRVPPGPGESGPAEDLPEPVAAELAGWASATAWAGVEQLATWAAVNCPVQDDGPAPHGALAALRSF